MELFYLKSLTVDPFCHYDRSSYVKALELRIRWEGGEMRSLFLVIQTKERYVELASRRAE